MVSEPNQNSNKLPQTKNGSQQQQSDEYMNDSRSINSSSNTMETSMNNLENLHKINQYSTNETTTKSPVNFTQRSNSSNNILNRFHSHDQHNLKSEMTPYNDQNHDHNVKKHQINDNKNIDDLARQFKESTHNLIANDNNKNLKTNNQLNNEQFISRSISCPNHFENNQTSSNKNIENKIESNNSIENLNKKYEHNTQQQQLQQNEQPCIIGIISGKNSNLSLSKSLRIFII